MQTTIINIGNGQQEVPVLAPEFNINLALVDINVIKRLAEQLPDVPLAKIKDHLMVKIEAANNLQRMLTVIEEELAFHKSVNLITTYEPPVTPH